MICDHFTTIHMSFYVFSHRNSSVYISLIYHRQDRSTRNRHVQSFILCDAHKNRSDQPLILGRNLTILRSKRAGFVQWQGILNAGTYALIPFSFTFWHDQGTPEDFTVVIHSVSKLQLQIKRVPATFLTDSLIAFLSQHSDYTKQVSIENDSGQRHEFIHFSLLLEE